MDPVYRVLIVCTGHADYPAKAAKTGAWLSDITHFCDEISDRKLPYVLATPQGGPIPIDDRSHDRRDTTNEKWRSNANFAAQLAQSVPLSEVNPNTFQIIYLAGGHGSLWDFPTNTTLQHLVRDIYEQGGMVSAVGHGVAGLLNVRLSDGSLLIADKQLTGFSQLEEKLMRTDAELPLQLEEAIRQKTPLYSKSVIPFLPHIEVNERLITGQNTLSVRKVARKILEEMYEK